MTLKVNNRKEGETMRIKHFAGYGTIEAKKISKTTKDNTTVLSVLVTGDHEQGLIPHYIIPGEPTNYSDYTIKKWIIDRFDKKAKNINNLRYQMECEYIGYNPDAVKYTFVYNYDNYFAW